MISLRNITCLCLLAGIFAVRIAGAESAWVSDRFEITLRSGPSTSNAIQLMLGSGTELEVLERDADSGYTRVRTRGGTEGWVLTRYLMNEPAAREQLATLTSQLTNEASRGSSLDAQLGAIRGEYDTAKNQIASLERDKSALETELAEIKRTASNVIAINNQNKDLREQLAAEEIRVAALEQENRALSSQTTRYWFLSGALVLVVGMILGLWLPRIRWQRRSRYDRF
jgi:SH3 domain protein